MNRFNFSLLAFILLIVVVVVVITLSPLTYWESTNDNKDEICYTQEQLDSLIVRAITDSLDSKTQVAENIINSPVISATRMNVFYRGLDNPVEISVPGVANDKLRVSISSGHKIKKVADGSYSVEPSNKNIAIISVKVEMPDGSIADLGSKKFRVKRIPTPVPIWAGKTPADKFISQNEVESFSPVAARIEDFDFDLMFRVKSFTLLVAIDGTFRKLTSENNKLTNDMKGLLGRARRGHIIYFEDILVGLPDGSDRILPTMKLTVK